MEFVHEQFGLQVDQHDDEQSLVNYLLNAAPLYGRLCSGDISVTDDDVKDCMGFAMPEDDTPRPKVRTELTPYGCPCSREASVCLDTELACFRCLSCGRMTERGYVHSFHDLSGSDTTTPYVYQPKTYLAQHLTRLQGQGHPKFSSEMVVSVRDDLVSDGVLIPMAMPNDVYEALKRLKLGRLYPHRWALTQCVNPTYQPLSLSHELCERLEHVFVVCYTQYASQRSKTGRKRKFLPYPVFIRSALEYLGVDVHFRPLRNKKTECQYIREIQCLLRGDAL